MTAARLIPGHAAIKQSRRRPRGFDFSWWTPERDEKLRYVMQTYGDREKAARVLGVSLQAVNCRLYILGREIAA